MVCLVGVLILFVVSVYVGLMDGNLRWLFVFIVYVRWKVGRRKFFLCV